MNFFFKWTKIFDLNGNIKFQKLNTNPDGKRKKHGILKEF